MRCPRCGNENPGSNRFCGMCGATLLPTPANSPAQQAAAQAPTAVSPLPPRSSQPPAAGPRSTNEPRPATIASESEPVISGPSFLGLNQPANRPSSSRSPSPDEPRRASLSIDPKSAPASRNLDYLLDDDEPRSGGAGKFILIVLALLLAVGLGYMRWKNQGLGWLSKGPSKPSAAAESPDSSDSNPSTSSPVTNPSSTPSSSPTQNPSSQTSTAATPASAPSSTPAQPKPSQPAPDAGSSSATPAGNAANGTSSAARSQSTEPETTSSAPDDSEAADASKSANAAPENAVPAAKPKAAIPKPAPRPADPVTEARKYLYGKGAKQDCERGMHLLKPEADRSNPKAMTEMGALYSAGLCTPRDLPTAYRWFALALRKNPDDQALQGDLQKLWDEMTQPERQQAIRLSQ